MTDRGDARWSQCDSKNYPESQQCRDVDTAVFDELSVSLHGGLLVCVSDLIAVDCCYCSRGLNDCSFPRGLEYKIF